MADPRVVGAVLRRDFYTFVRASFPIISPNDSFAPNWHIEAMAFALTRVLEGEIKRLIITVPPRSLKSICASVAYPAYVLGHDPDAADHLCQLRRRARAQACQRLSCTHALNPLPPLVPEYSDQPGQGHRIGVRDHARGKPAVDLGWGHPHGPRRQPHHRRRSPEAAGRPFGDSAQKYHAMVLEHAA